MKIVTILLLPFSLIYGFILHLRNKFYDWNIFKSSTFNFPTIAVGNLAIGGTGKTPHIEYLICLLNKEYKVATLSRGYKRETKGFYLSDNNSNVASIGDEPLQYKLKFSNLLVAVDEKRVNGIKRIKEIHPETNIILLDDAYQHRALKPGINILITDYRKLYVNDRVLPSGKLREWSFGSDRADIIVVSKTDNTLSLIERENLKKRLNAKPHQKIYFSYIKYGEITPFTHSSKILKLKIKNLFNVLLVTGIANPNHLFNHLNDVFPSVTNVKFSDHHNYTNKDVISIKEKFNTLHGNNKIIITTEKDIMRLSLPRILNQLQEVPIFYIPIEICFHGTDKQEFDNQIMKYVTKNSRN